MGQLKEFSIIQCIMATKEIEETQRQMEKINESSTL